MTMNTIIRSVLGGIVVLLPLATAQAADSGPYVTLGVGVSGVGDFSMQSPDAGAPLDKPGTNVVAGLAVGYRFSPAFRADIGVSYRPESDFNTTDSQLGLNYATNLKSLRGFVTGYVDVAGLMEPGALGAFSPFVGFGVGLARNSLKDITVTDLTAPTNAQQFTISGEDHTNLAWKAVAGVGYALTSAITIEGAFQYVDAGTVKSGATLNATGTGAELGSVPFNAFQGNLRTYEATIGLRYQF